MAATRQRCSSDSTGFWEALLATARKLLRRWRWLLGKSARACHWTETNIIHSGVVKTHFTVEKMDKLNDVFQRMDKGELQGRVVLDLTS